jgi:SAM-dependent methyltransferase
MPRRDLLDPRNWRQVHEEIDRSVAEAAQIYLHKLAIRRIRFDRDVLLHEVAELKMGREPDYNKPGFALLYALRYMPRRTIAILGSLNATLIDRYPTAVLDVGSGTGASTLALELLDAPRHIFLAGLEQSAEMIAFAQGMPARRRVSSHFEQGSLLDVMDSMLKQRRFELVVLSAALPYEFNQWSKVSDAFGAYESNEGTMILIVEPESKAHFLDALEKRFMANGWPTMRLCCHDLPDILKENDLPLRKMKSLAHRLGLDEDVFPIRSWWNPPDDRFLIANPEPAWIPGPSPVLSPSALQALESGLPTSI